MNHGEWRGSQPSEEQWAGQQEQYQAYAQPQMASQAMPAERVQFIQKTYLHLIGAIMATIATMFLFAFSPLYAPAMNFLFAQAGGMGWLVVLVVFMFGTGFCERLAHRPSKTAQFTGLGLMVLLFSFILSLPVAFAVASGGAEVIIQALMITFFTLAALTVMVFKSGIDFSILRTGLVVGGVLVLVAIVAAIVFGFSLGLGFVILMVGYMAAMITYQTSEIYHKYNVDQHVGAATGLYASVGILFWYVLHLVGWD